ncbi:helix-turn-helix transcriptional regulator [Paenibacillus sp. FSL R5-0527]|uniref:Helix-turn-helix family protein n=2 Tax=Paenibacillus TaxID=44249 RepID=A0A090ZCG5_PAEMA|nr:MULTISPECIES: helix-turn-helix transcriptional regulator [Paenibacillus]KFN08342.1 helix-turn-helix family protein [Paenibacillus macerans]MBS5914871.1 helix-turn-helix transcriptional regulator [Paenibacillus macerans]MCY7557713.1 helix-turn-helix domain-containing protein [Paenibacillus macerans]MEC0152398.1 helix-turn-helix transcriptional regulator [Paenibacillus macerans]MEC0329162.1 helix-turn-helix transcriptional regulator [Paenibacillus macerans]
MYKRIRDLREDRDLTQQQLADYLNISQATYSRYESGNLDVPSSVLIKLSEFYNVSIDYILGQTNISKRPNGK